MMKRIAVLRIAIAAAIVLVAMTATTTVAFAMRNGRVNELTALLRLINGHKSASISSEGAGLHITVLPAPEPTPIPDSGTRVALLGNPSLLTEGKLGLGERVISNVLSMSARILAPLPPSRPPAKEPSPPKAAGPVTAELAPDKPATLTSEDSQLTVQAPAGATMQACVLSVGPVTEAPEAPGLTVLSTVFEVTAETPAGEQVWRFAKPLELAFRVPAEQASAFLRHEIRAFFWHPKFSAWLAVPSEYDPATSTVRAWVDHLTRFAVMAGPGFPALADIRGHWSETDVVALASYKPQGVRVVSGYEDGTFRPDRTVTRQEFIKLAVVALGLKPKEEPQLPFADAESIPEWSRGYIAAAVSASLVKGYEDGTFRPFAEISRAEMAVIVARCLSGSGAVESVLRYGDVASIPAWAVRAVALCTERDILRGYEDGTFRPAATTTRAQAAVVVWRLLEAR